MRIDLYILDDVNKSINTRRYGICIYNMRKLHEKMWLLGPKLIFEIRPRKRRK